MEEIVYFHQVYATNASYFWIRYTSLSPGCLALHVLKFRVVFRTRSKRRVPDGVPSVPVIPLSKHNFILKGFTQDVLYFRFLMIINNTSVFPFLSRYKLIQTFYYQLVCFHLSQRRNDVLSSRKLYEGAYQSEVLSCQQTS